MSPKPQPHIPDIGYCEEKTRLLYEFVQSIHDVNDLQSQQMRAVIDGETDFTRFDLMLHEAHEKKNKAKYAWIAHVESHRCEG